MTDSTFNLLARTVILGIPVVGLYYCHWRFSRWLKTKR